MEKKNNNIKDNSRLKFSEVIACHQLLYINVTQQSVLLTRLYGCVAEERYKLVELLPVLINDYDQKQYLKTIFLRLVDFLEQSKFF